MRCTSINQSKLIGFLSLSPFQTYACVFMGLMVFIFQFKQAEVGMKLNVRFQQKYFLLFKICWILFENDNAKLFNSQQK